MSGLFGMLSTTARSLDAQRYGLDSAGQNIANVNTPGYSRRVVDFGAVPPTSERLNAGNGVEVLGVRSHPRPLLRSPAVPGECRRSTASRRWPKRSASSKSSLGTPDATLNARLNQFFDGFSALAQAPTSSDRARPTCWHGASCWPARSAPPTAASSRRSSTPTAASAPPSTRSTRSPAGWRRSTTASPTPTPPARCTLRDEQNEVVRELSSLRGHRDDRSPERHRADLVRPRPAAGDWRRRLRGDDARTSRPPASPGSTAVSPTSPRRSPAAGSAGLIAARDVNIPGYRSAARHAGLRAGAAGQHAARRRLHARRRRRAAVLPAAGRRRRRRAAHRGRSGRRRQRHADRGRRRRRHAWRQRHGAGSSPTLRDARVLSGNSATFTSFCSRPASTTSARTQRRRHGAAASAPRSSTRSTTCATRLGRVARRGSRDDDALPACLRSQRALLHHRRPDARVLRQSRALGGAIMRVTFGSTLPQRA